MFFGAKSVFIAQMKMMSPKKINGRGKKNMMIHESGMVLERTASSGRSRFTRHRVLLPIGLSAIACLMALIPTFELISELKKS